MTVGTVGSGGSTQQAQQAQQQTHSASSTPFNLRQLQASSTAAGSDVESAESAVTSEERSYFEELFPAASSEIRSYRTYSPGGLRNSTVSGTLFDRKG